MEQTVVQPKESRMRRRHGAVLRAIDTVHPWRYALFVGWTIAWSALHSSSSGLGWHYFETGTRLLFSPRGLDIYATHSELQIGPLTFVALSPLVVGLSAPAAQVVGAVLMAAAGVGALRLVERIQPPGVPGGRVRFLLLGLLTIPVWSEVSVHWSHPDDVLAMLAVLGAVLALRSDHLYMCAALLAAATDSKPWAVIFAGLILCADRKYWVRMGAIFAAVVAGAWLPFILADPSTLHAASFQIAVSPASVLHLFGVSGGTPPWCRPAQVILGAAAVAVLALRGRWPAAIVVGLGVRMLLDPGTKGYYEASLIVGTALFDAIMVIGWIPITTAAVVALIFIPGYVAPHATVARAVLALLCYSGVCVLAATRPLRPSPAAVNDAAGAAVAAREARRL